MKRTFERLSKNGKDILFVEKNSTNIFSYRELKLRPPHFTSS